MANKSLDQFYEDFNEEIQVSYETDSSGWNKNLYYCSGEDKQKSNIELLAAVDNEILFVH